MLKLDVGCGNNKKLGYIGIEVDKSEATDILASAECLPFKQNSVSIIYSRRVIQHVKNDEKAFQEMFYVLKPQGKVYIIVASFLGYLYFKLGLSASKHKYHTFHLYYKSKLVTMLKHAGFSNIKVSKITSRRFSYDLTLKAIKP